MAKTLQFRRGTTSELSTQTGAVGEIFIDTNKDTVVVMDGSTPGGFPLQQELISNTNIKTVNGQSLLGAGDINVSGGNLSAVAQDIEPQFSGAFDIGSTDKRWFNAYLANGVDIEGVQLTAANGALVTTSDVVVGSLLADDLLLSNNMITPSAAFPPEYSGEYGTVVINGNLDIQGALATNKILANNTYGTPGQVLTTNGSEAYWTSLSGGGSINPYDDFEWYGDHTFAANVSIGNPNLMLGSTLNLGTKVRLVANNTSGTSGQVLTSNGSSVYWSTPAVSGETVIDTYVGGVDFDAPNSRIINLANTVVIRTISSFMNIKLQAMQAGDAFQYTVNGNTYNGTISSPFSFNGMEWTASVGPANDPTLGSNYYYGPFDNGGNFNIVEVRPYATENYVNAEIETAIGNHNTFNADINPGIGDVYDVGRANNRWYDAYLSNKVDIGGAEIFGSEAGVAIPNAALIDQLLVSDNMITPDDTSARQYMGDKGAVIINGNLDVDGDWLGAPVVETIPGITEVLPGTLDASGVIKQFGHSTSTPQILGTVKQNDGKLIVYGYFDTYNGQPCSDHIIRLNVDGTVDSTFQTTGFENPSSSPAIYTVVIDDTRNIIYVGGTFTRYNGQDVGSAFIALNMDGSINQQSGGFIKDNGNWNAIVRTISLVGNGVFVGGYFDTYSDIYGPQNAKGLTRFYWNSSNQLQFDIDWNNTWLNADVRLNNGQPITVYATVYDEVENVVWVGGAFEIANRPGVYGASTGPILAVNMIGDVVKGTRTAYNPGGGAAIVYDLFLDKNSSQASMGYPRVLIAVGNMKTIYGELQSGVGFFSSQSGDPIHYGPFPLKGNIIDIPDQDFLGTYAYAVDQDNQGGFLIGGRFSTVLGRASYKLFRLNNDYSIDTTFTSPFAYEDFDILNIKVYDDYTYLGKVGGNLSRLIEPVEGTPEITPPIGGEEGFIRYNKDISAFQGYNGTTWELLERVTTPPTQLDSTGTIDIDFSGATLRTQGALTGDVTYTGSSYSAGSSVTIRVKNGSTERTLTFPAGWVFVGAKPTSITANKTAILTITSFGTTEADCVVAWAEQE